MTLSLVNYRLIILLIFCLAPAVSAHNVVSGVYADGMLIEGEVGFSNGDMAAAGSPVKVFNTGGDLIAELVLGEAGAFSYEAETIGRYIFKANLSAGHVAEMVIEPDELSAPAVVNDVSRQMATKNTSLKSEPLKVFVPMNKTTQTVMLGNNITVEQLQSIVRSAVAQQVRPLQKELKAYKEKVMFRDITGGLGFIFGLFGVAAWMASRRGDKPLKGENDAAVS